MKKTLADFQPLKPAEQELLECCKSGEIAVIGEERPTEKTETNEIRAEFLRWLILTKDIDIDLNGIDFKGAWVSGMLNLINSHSLRILGFFNSVFEKRLFLMGATTQTICGNGSLFGEGINADGLICHGDLNFRNGFESKGEVRFLSAKIRGNFDCNQSTFKASNKEQYTLACDGIYVHGDVILDGSNTEGEVRFLGANIEGNFTCNNTIFKALTKESYALTCDKINVHGSIFLCNSRAEGEVRFLGANIEGNFTCNNTIFKASNKEQYTLSCDKINVHGSIFLCNSRAEGEVRFLGANIEGNFDCTNATFKVLNCESIDIRDGLFLRDGYVSHGEINLRHVTVSALLYDNAFWEHKSLKEVKLDGFKYEHIYIHARNTNENKNDIKASFFLKNMLGKMPEFKPQPYKQLAKVLREMGHDRDADEVMIALHDKKLEFSKDSWLYKKFRQLYKWTSEYGYRPMRILKIMATIWLIFGCIYWYGANVAVFAPTNPLIFQKQDYNCTIDKNGTKWLAFPKDYNATNNWYEASPPEYTTFQPFWYSLDIILPVVDLKMENDWGVVIPSPDGSFFKIFNYFIRFLTWFETLAGWYLSLILVAILSGLAKNEKE